MTVQQTPMAPARTLCTAYPPKPATATKLVCFSFAAYAKTLIDRLKSLNIPILPGLSDPEFSSVESTFHFTFPPDLRSILQEGLPIGPHFPNWRSSSPQQLQVLLNLPSFNLFKCISQNDFWVDSWGNRPDDRDEAVEIARGLLGKAPVLVPIYKNCYIPSSPCTAGNPVFWVDDGGVRVLSFDVGRFFQEVEFLQMGAPDVKPVRKGKVGVNAPAWAATAARRVEFWTEAAESGRRVAAGEAGRGWWSGGHRGCLDCHWQLRECLEGVFWRLRDGGWREEEVRDMMMMDGRDHEREEVRGLRLGKGGVTWHLSVLSVALLRAGWSREDVVYSLDLHDLEDDNVNKGSNNNKAVFGGKVLPEFQLPNGCSREGDDHQKSSMKQLMKLQAPRY